MILKDQIKVSIAQISPVLGDLDKNLDIHYVQIEQAIKEGSDIIVFPELSLTGYSLKDAVYDVALSCHDAKYDKLRDLSRKISIIVGAAELSEEYQIYNSLYLFEDKKLLSRHRKVYLPNYGLFEEKRYFSEGSRFRAFNSKHGRFGMLVCEDMWHPTSGLILAQDGAAVIFVATAGVARGVGEHEQPENVRIWETLNRALAVNTTSFIVFANRVGVEDGLMFWGGSEVIGPHGARNAKAAYFKEDHLVQQIDMLKLKHARINTTLLSDEKLNIVIDELSRVDRNKKEY